MVLVKERLRQYPLTHATALAMAWTALQTASFGLSGALPVFPTLTLAFIAVLAAACVLAGVQWRGSQINRLAIEKVGHVFMATAWVVVAWPILALAFGSGAIAAGPPLILAAGSVIRACELHRQKRAQVGIVKEAVRAARRDDTEGGL